jgi:predicted acylesterase/phospholipase RssA
VLSGGAARGIAHIGVIRALEEEGIRPGLVCGTSMGALVGALYATGYSSGQIRDIFLSTDWEQIFGRGKETFEWRDTVVPQPWVALIGEGFEFHLPSGVVDDSYLNFTLAQFFLPSEAIAQGDFDRLPIPFRCVGTDAETASPIVFRSGSVARAVRASICIPPLFPAVPDGNTLLVDGGLASNMPVSTARNLGPRRILAIDVALPAVDLTDRSSMIDVSFSIFDRLNKRSQQDTLSADDRLVALDLKGYGPMDFAGCDSLIELGYREARARIHEFAQLVSAAPDSGRPDSVHIVLPPARPDVAWLDPDSTESPRAQAAMQMFGEVPSSAFEPQSLRNAFTEVFRGDMFVSAWPSFGVTGDSTTLAMSVVSRPKSEVLIAFAYDNDYHARLNTTLVLRPLRSRLPDKISVGFTIDPLRKNLFFALEPHSLARGSNGWFLRGGWRETDVRLFDEDRRIDETRVERVEAMVGGQKRLTRSYVLQAGAGYGFAGTEHRDLYGLIGSVRIQSGSKFGEGVQAVFLSGQESYAALVARMTYDLRTGPITLRLAGRAGTSTHDTPPDELQAVGGPESFVGIRRREWLGHDRIAGEVRALHNVASYARVFAYGQAAFINGAVSRPDLDGEAHIAAGAGFEADIPFGPLNIDWGIDDQGDFRLDFNFGQRF